MNTGSAGVGIDSGRRSADTQSHTSPSRSYRRLGAGFAVGGVAIALVTACYVHTRAHMIAPIIDRPSLCQAAVQFFDAPSDLTKPYLEVARLSVWWPADMIARVSTVEGAMRKKAAQLGANGLIRGRLVGGDTVQPRYERDVAGVAIFVPGDSARAAAACASAGVSPGSEVL